MRVFISAGEPSGDLHGASLVRELRRLDGAVQCMGFGGPRMAQAGFQLHGDLTQLSFMWFARVAWRLPDFARHVRHADHFFRHNRPDVVVLIDYPGFNWWLARRAKRYGIPVVYYGTPQIWAWAPWRVRKMRRLADHVLCKLPFEAAWYREHGCAATYVGHPYWDYLESLQFDQTLVARLRSQPGALVTLLPGSRDQEVAANLPVFLRTSQCVHQVVPATRFAVAAFRPRHAQWMRPMVKRCGVPLEVYVGKTPELIQAATCCLACSGSVSLELLYFGKPSVVHYRVGRLAFWVQGYLRHVRYISLTNLLACEDRFCRRAGWAEGGDESVPFPEYVTWRDRSERLAQHLVRWLSDGAAYQAACARLARVKSELGSAGTSQRVAEFLLDRVGHRGGGCAVNEPGLNCRAA